MSGLLLAKSSSDEGRTRTRLSAQALAKRQRDQPAEGKADSALGNRAPLAGGVHLVGNNLLPLEAVQQPGGRDDCSLLALGVPMCIKELDVGHDGVRNTDAEDAAPELVPLPGKTDLLLSMRTEPNGLAAKERDFCVRGSGVDPCSDMSKLDPVGEFLRHVQGTFRP